MYISVHHTKHALKLNGATFLRHTVEVSRPHERKSSSTTDSTTPSSATQIDLQGDQRFLKEPGWLKHLCAEFSKVCGVSHRWLVPLLIHFPPPFCATPLGSTDILPDTPTLCRQGAKLLDCRVSSQGTGLRGPKPYSAR